MMNCTIQYGKHRCSPPALSGGGVSFNVIFGGYCVGQDD